MIGSIILNDIKETDKVIIFIHIPKTAGSTLHGIINSQYKIIDWYPENLWNYNLPLETKKRIEVVRGHVTFGIHNYLPQKNYTYFTLLRNPIERVISHYYHIKKDADNEFHEELNKISLYDFVTNEKYNEYTFNLQTRYLTEDNTVNFQKSEFNLKNFFSIVGTTERFNETLYLIKKEFNWNISSYEKLNIGQNRASLNEIPQDVILAIKEKNQYDIKLYELANSLLNQKLFK